MLKLKRTFPLLSWLLLLTFVISACGPAATETPPTATLEASPTAAPPTATPEPSPTATAAPTEAPTLTPTTAPAADAAIAARLTGDPRFPAVIVHKNGERIFAVADATGVTGGLWILPSGQTVLALLGADGKPAQMAYGDKVAQYSDYTVDSLTATLLAPEAQAYPEIKVDFFMLEQFATPALPPEGRSLWDTLRPAVYAVGVTGCAIDYARSGALDSETCASPLLRSVVQLHDTLGTGVAAVIDSSGNALEMLACAGQTSEACLTSLVQTAVSAEAAAQATLTAVASGQPAPTSALSGTTPPPAPAATIAPPTVTRPVITRTPTPDRSRITPTKQPAWNKKTPTAAKRPKD